MGYTPPQLEVRKVTGGWSIHAPTSTTGDDLFIYPNTTDTTASIVLYGGLYATITGTAPNILGLMAGSTEAFRISYATPDAIIEGKVADKNIFLKTAGTGVIKFGTHTGSGDVACNGSIAILDAGGTPRKLMTTA